MRSPRFGGRDSSDSSATGAPPLGLMIADRQVGSFTLAVRSILVEWGLPTGRAELSTGVTEISYCWPFHAVAPGLHTVIITVRNYSDLRDHPQPATGALSNPRKIEGLRGWKGFLCTPGIL
jgi:hypothetical protein